MNNILIIGAPRCGKSSLSNEIIKKHTEYEIVRGDVLIAFYENFTKKIIEKDDGSCEVILNKISNKEKAQILSKYVDELKVDLNPINKKILVESCDIDLLDAIDLFEDDFDIFCLGIADTQSEELMRKFRENDTKSDWTYCSSDTKLKRACEFIIETSKENKKICEQSNINFFEMSGDRKKKISNAIENIEKISIEY